MRAGRRLAQHRAAWTQRAGREVSGTAEKHHNDNSKKKRRKKLKKKKARDLFKAFLQDWPPPRRTRTRPGTFHESPERAISLAGERDQSVSLKTNGKQTKNTQ